MKRGFFITIEGGEGAGKTTLLEAMKKELLSRKYSLVITREPGGTKLGEEVRNLLLKRRKEKVAFKAELCLFLASRAQHIKDVILPSKKDGKIVLCDRFNDSTLAYQGYARGLGLEDVIEFSSYIVKDALPDLTLYLDLDPKIGLSRVKSKYDRIEAEKVSFHQKIRKGFFILAEKYPERIKIINASKSPAEVYRDSMNFIDELLKTS